MKLIWGIIPINITDHVESYLSSCCTRFSQTFCCPAALAHCQDGGAVIITLMTPTKLVSKTVSKNGQFWQNSFFTAESSPCDFRSLLLRYYDNAPSIPACTFSQGLAHCWEPVLSSPKNTNMLFHMERATAMTFLQLPQHFSSENIFSKFFPKINIPLPAPKSTKLSS